MQTIDVTPKWTAVVRICAEVLKNPNANHADKCNATNELLVLAKYADQQNALNRKKSLTKT